MSPDAFDHDVDAAAGDPMPGLPRVAASEHELLSLMRALLLGATGRAEAWTVFALARDATPTIGPTAAGLLAETLRSTWRAIALRGGTVPGRSITPQGIAAGRLWQRHAAVPLPFTGATVALLQWLVSTPLAQAASRHRPLPAQPLAVGDQVVIYLALEAARNTPAALPVAATALVRAAPLAWLAAPDLLAAARPGAVPPAFASLATDVGAIVVDGLASDLARQWAAIERTKRGERQPATLLALGAAQDATLTGFFAACDAARRRDLAGWVLDAAAPGLAAPTTCPEPRALDGTTPLAQRSQARVAAGSLLRGVMRWAAWDREHRGVRFFEDEYALTQLLLARFERIGAVGADRAASWLEALAALYPASIP